MEVRSSSGRIDRSVALYASARKGKVASEAKDAPVACCGTGDASISVTGECNPECAAGLRDERD